MRDGKGMKERRTKRTRRQVFVMGYFYGRGFEKAVGKRRKDNREEGWLKKKGKNLRDCTKEGNKKLLRGEGEDAR